MENTLWNIYIFYFYFLFIYLFIFAVALRPNAGHGLLVLEVSRSHTTTHHSRQDSSGRVTSPSQRPLPDNTQHSQQTNIHAPGGIQTHDLSRRTGDQCLRPRGHWDRRNIYMMNELDQRFPNFAPRMRREPRPVPRVSVDTFL